MRVVLAAALIAALAPAAPAAPAVDEATYTLTLDIGGVWGKSWIDAIEASLSRLDGVKSAKKGSKKTQYVVKVLETKFHLPCEIQKSLSDKFSLQSVRVEMSGTAAKEGEKWVFTARASNRKLEVKPSDDFKKLVEAGKTNVTITGVLDESEELEGEGEDAKRKCTPSIEVSSAKETEEKK